MSDSGNQVDLPEGWKQSVDPLKNRTYYYNKSVNVSTWTKPPSSLNLISGWEICYNKDNKRWYYRNETLQITQWDAPSAEQVNQSPKQKQIQKKSPPPIPPSISDKEYQQQQTKQENSIRRISETQSNKQENPIRRISETKQNIPAAPPIPNFKPKLPQPIQHHSPKDDEHEIVIKTFPSGLKKEIQQFNKPSFAEQYFRKHTKGFFIKKQIPPGEMMQMQTHSLKAPILISIGKDKEKLALINFDNILIYQGLKQNFRFGQRLITSESDKKTNELMATVAQSIVNLGYQNESLCNEIICQLIKQTTVGPQAVKELQPAVLSDAIRKGWQLIMLCLERFAPLRNCESILLDHIDKAMDMNIGDFSAEKDEQSLKEEISMYATFSLNKLLSLVKFGGILKIDEKKITNIQQVTKARKVFDCLLQDIMVHQSHLLTPEKDFIVPTVMLFLIIKIIQNNGLKTEGIFRKSGVTIDDTEEAIALLNMGDYNNQYFKDQKNPHAYAVLLKNWLRRLEECIIPYALYDDALKTVLLPNPDEENVVRMTPYQFVLSKLPLANLLTLKVLSRFLKKVYSDENVKYNLMSLQNIAIIFAPTLIKSNSNDNSVVAKNIHTEISFIQIVIFEIGNFPYDGDEDKITQAEKWVMENYCKDS